MRQSYYTESWEKKLELYQSFIGGMNSTTSSENMKDNEMNLIINMSMNERGSLAKRTGISLHREPVSPVQNAQGYFTYYRKDGSKDTFLAYDGQLELNGSLVQDIAFQTERPIEAVQYVDKLYIATGTKLLVYDGTTVAPIIPKAPQPLEAIYIGTNGLADDPDQFLSDGEGTFLQLAGVTFSSRYGVMNQPFTLTAYVTKPVEAIVEYQFEYRLTTDADGAYTLGQDWSTQKTWTHQTVGTGDYQFRINARKQGGTAAEVQYLVPKYTVKPTPDPVDNAPKGGVQTCNRILLHWDRILLYGDPINTNVLYMSHLKDPSYVPVPNYLRFESLQNEPITNITRFRDFLIVFTETTVQALYGKSPTDYSRAVLNTSAGCISPFGAVVMNNYVAFVAKDGIYYLKSVGYVEDKANVARIDMAIGNKVNTNDKFIATVYGSDLMIVDPVEREAYRFHIQLGAWVMDTSNALDLVQFRQEDGLLYGLRSEGQVVYFDSSVYTDLNNPYDAIVETAYIDFGYPLHVKKLKEIQFMAQTDFSYVPHYYINGGILPFETIKRTINGGIIGEQNLVIRMIDGGEI